MRNRRKKKNRWLNIAEGAVLAGLLLFIILMLRNDISRDVPMEELRQILLSQPGTQELLEKTGSGVNQSMGLIPSEYLYYRTDAIMDVREIFLVKEEDDTQMEQIRQAAQNHLQTQIDNFTGYGTNQIDLLEHAIYGQKGNYYYLLIGEDADTWQQAILKTIS